METVVWIGTAVLVGIAVLVATISRKSGGSRPAGSRTVRAAAGTDHGRSSWDGWGGDSGGGGGGGG
jgi:hypothetical protein